MTLFTQHLLLWYEENRRVLPWRGETDPYKIWVSEIILQQTRVIQGWNYYLNFINAFPTIRSLAEASEIQILQIWQGLGYYSRAINMHKAAKQIMTSYNGIFPKKYNQIIELQGIGKYTAAAIASIAFQLPYPAIDGNVLRVVSRYMGIFDEINSQKTYNIIEGYCNNWISNAPAGIFNQAMMELGAICCKPKQPTCSSCPISSQCFAFLNEKTDLLPIKRNKCVVKTRYLHYLLCVNDNKIIISKRKQNDIWKHLYEFPLIETPEYCQMPTSDIRLFLRSDADIPTRFLFEIKHQLTHQKLIIRFYSLNSIPKILLNTQVVNIDSLHKYPFPLPLQNVVELLTSSSLE